MNFSQGHSGTKVQCESCLFSQGKTPEFTKVGEIRELFVLALSLVWLTGATPDVEPFFAQTQENKQKMASNGTLFSLRRKAVWIACCCDCCSKWSGRLVFSERGQLSQAIQQSHVGRMLQPRPPLTGVSRALRARNPERVSKESPGAGKCPKQSQNSLRSLKIDCFETPETVSRLFRTLFGPRGRKAPGDSFETLSGFRARRARETPVRGGRRCKTNAKIRGQKNRTRKKKNSWERRFPGTFRTPMFPWFCLFSLSFQWEEGQKFPGTLFLGTFFSYFRWFFSFRLKLKMNERQSRDSNRNTTNAGSVRTNLCGLGGDMTTNER